MNLLKSQYEIKAGDLKNNLFFPDTVNIDKKIDEKGLSKIKNVNLYQIEKILNTYKNLLKEASLKVKK